MREISRFCYAVFVVFFCPNQQELFADQIIFPRSCDLMVAQRQLIFSMEIQKNRYVLGAFRGP